MLTIGHETLYTKTEILKNIRTFLADHPDDEAVQKLFIDDVAMVLSIAIEESRDFIKGAIRPTGKEVTR